MNQASNIRVVTFLIYETRGHADQFRRAYNPVIDGTTQMMLEERIVATDRVTTDTVMGIANNFLKPSERIDDTKPIAIVNGWNAPRCRFYLELEYDFGGIGSKMRECFMGYTDLSASDGLSLQTQQISPDMRFYMNSVTHLKHQQLITPNGREQLFTVVDSSQILTNHEYAGARDGNGHLFRMRPDDLFATMGTTHLEMGGLFDQRTVMDVKAVKANRSSTSAAPYMARILDAYLSASKNSGDFGNNEPVDILDAARARCMQQSSSAQDPFMRQVAQHENGGSFIQDSFSYRTLCAIDPNADNIAEVNMMGSLNHERTNFVGDATDTNSWSDQTIYAQFAAILGQAVPTIMMECGLREIWFSSTNRKLNGMIETGITHMASFSDLFSLHQQGNTFIDRVDRELMYDLSFNNTMDYQLEMQMSMHGECVINLALNGQQHYERFVAPLFADSLMSPIITNSQGRMLTMARKFGELGEGLACNNLLGSAMNGNIQIASANMAF